MGPYFLVSLLGLDTVLHVAEHLAESYGDERFYMPKGMQKLVSEGKLGAKTGGDGFYDPQGEPNLDGDGEPDVARARWSCSTLKTFVEACLVLEEGVASHRDIDFGMMAGAGLDPRRGGCAAVHARRRRGARHDARALGERPASATASASPRPRSCAAWSRRAASGRSAGRASTPTRSPTPSQPGEGRQARDASRRGRDRVAGQRPDERDRPRGDRGPRKVWEQVKAADPPIHALVIASSNPFLYSAGADIKAFTQMDEAGGERLIDDAHALFRELGSERIATIAAVNGLAFGGGCELAMACDLRIVARSAIFGQPEIKLGIIPGFGGTQRLPRLVGQSKALEMNLVGDPLLAEEAYEYGLASAVVDDHELLDTALAWARKLAGQAPLARGADQAGLRGGRPRRGDRRREGRLRHGLPERRRARGDRRVPGQTRAAVRGEVVSRAASAPMAATGRRTR